MPNQKTIYPLSDINKDKLVDDFADYFLNKIEKIRELFKGKVKYSSPIRSCSKLPDLKPLTEEQVLTLIQHMHYTTCTLVPSNTKFLMKFKDTLIQGCHASGRNQGKTKFSPGQGIVGEFWKMSGDFCHLTYVREFCHDIFFRLRLHHMVMDIPGLS